MKSLAGLMLMLLAMLVFASAAQSQILKRLKDRAKQKVEDKIEQRVDQKIDETAEKMVEKSWNSIFGNGFGSEDSSSGYSFLLNNNVNTEDRYTFDVITTMEIQDISDNNNREAPIQMVMHFNDDELYTGTRFSGEDMNEGDGDVFIIYDFKNEAMVMLMKSDDGNFSSAYDWKQISQITDEAEVEQEEDWPGFEKIGTRTIAGSISEGYLSVSEDSRTEVWVTQDHDFGFQRMFRANAGTRQLKGKLPENYPAGMMMEMTHEDLVNGNRIILRVTDIRKNVNITYSMSDYSRMGMGG